MLFQKHQTHKLINHTRSKPFTWDYKWSTQTDMADTLICCLSCPGKCDSEGPLPLSTGTSTSTAHLPKAHFKLTLETVSHLDLHLITVPWTAVHLQFIISGPIQSKLVLVLLQMSGGIQQ
jgi:hypothetical protein